MSHGLHLHSARPVVCSIPGVGINIAAGTTVPSDGEVGYAPGCIFQKTNGSSESNYLYVNVGTLASANFDAVDLNVAEAALLSGVLATADEINHATDVSTRVVPLAVTTAITIAAHEGRTITMSGAGGARTFTLPSAAAANVGAKFRFVVAEVNTSNYLIKSVSGADLFKGIVIGVSTTDSATDAPRTWRPGASDDTITLNGTTTGGVAIGDYLDIELIAANVWQVSGAVTQSGTEATMFSDTVA